MCEQTKQNSVTARELFMFRCNGIPVVASYPLVPPLTIHSVGSKGRSRVPLSVVIIS